MVIRFFHPSTTANDLRLRRISIPDVIHYIIFLSYFLRKSQYFPFQCSVQIKGTTGTIFITSLVWCGPWLGIEPETSGLEASTLPLGYRGSGIAYNDFMEVFIKMTRIIGTTWLFSVHRPAAQTTHTVFTCTTYTNGFPWDVCSGSFGLCVGVLQMTPPGRLHNEPVWLAKNDIWCIIIINCCLTWILLKLI